MKANYTLILLVMLFALSCSDSGTNVVEEFDYKDYMQLDSGNSWSYDYFGINSSGEHYTVRYGFDSTLAKDTLAYNGRKAIRLTKVMNNQGEVTESDSYCSVDSSQLAIAGLSYDVDGALVVKNETWVTVYDLYKASWQGEIASFQDSLVDKKLYSGNIVYYASNQGLTKVEYGGDLIDALSTNLKISYRFFVSHEDKIDTIRQLEEYEFRFAKGLGLVYTQYMKYEQDSVLVGGYERVITKFGK